jgi:hypothetical protein
MIDYVLLITRIITILIAFVVHESGHYFAYKLLKLKPKFKLTTMGVEIYSNNQHLITIKQLYILSIAGILAGLPFVWNDDMLLTAYTLGCCVDLTNVYTYFTCSKEDRKLSQKDFTLKQIKEFEQLSFEV